jgi:hypothetical protein
VRETWRAQLRYIYGRLIGGRPIMTMLRYLGKDPESSGGQSPTVWDAGDCYAVQGWIPGAEILAQVGTVPSGESVVLIPKRLMPVFPEVSGAGASEGAIRPTA